MANVSYRFIVQLWVDTYALLETTGVRDINGQVISCMFLIPAYRLWACFVPS